MIGIIDYGLGNIRAFENIYRRLGLNAAPVRTVDELATADRLILPGVGAFDWAMGRLEQSGMINLLQQRVLEEGVPVLGVCVGMQMMANSSEEGVAPGLGWIPGRVIRFQDAWFSQKTRLPHMGWNDILPESEQSLFRDLTNPKFYFLHSYFFEPNDEKHVIARAKYGMEFAAAIRHKNIFATQFHPEKSHEWGIALLRNFAVAG